MSSRWLQNEPYSGAFLAQSSWFSVVWSFWAGIESVEFWNWVRALNYNAADLLDSWKKLLASPTWKRFTQKVNHHTSLPSTADAAPPIAPGADLLEGEDFQSTRCSSQPQFPCGAYTCSPFSHCNHLQFSPQNHLAHEQIHYLPSIFHLPSFVLHLPGAFSTAQCAKDLSFTCHT